MAKANGVKTAVDSSVIIAALLTWHEHHTAARDLLEEAFESGEVLLPSRVLVESFSVMTRMPVPHRLSSEIALELLSRSFEEQTTLIDFQPGDRWKFLCEWAGQGVAGGLIYDAEIVEAALVAGATRLITLNQRDFERIAPVELQVGGPNPDLT